MQIILNSISMSFGKTEVFSGLSCVFENNISVILGSNGSGKTTILRILTGLFRQLEGEVLYKGFSDNFLSDENRDIFLSSPEINLYSDLSVEENITLICDLKGTPFPDLSGWELESYLVKKYSDLSSGYKQRVKLLTSFVIDSELLLLDEPEQHLDKNGIIKLTEEIEKRAEKNRMTIIATNNLWKEWNVSLTL